MYKRATDSMERRERQQSETSVAEKKQQDTGREGVCICKKVEGEGEGEGRNSAEGICVSALCGSTHSVSGQGAQDTMKQQHTGVKEKCHGGGGGYIVG